MNEIQYADNVWREKEGVAPSAFNVRLFGFWIAMRVGLGMRSRRCPAIFRYGAEAVEKESLAH